MRRLTAVLTSFLIAAFWSNGASAAICLLGPCGGGGGTSVAPEIDGSAGLAAIVLLISVGAVAYRKIQRR